MKLLIQTLKKMSNNTGYEVDISLNEEITSKNFNEAKKRAIILKAERNPHKIRIIEYRNDEPDNTRTACKILFED